MSKSFPDEKWVKPKPNLVTGNENPTSTERPKSQELTAFSPYNALKNSELAFQGTDEPRQAEDVTFLEKDESKSGSARIFFKKMFAGNQAPQAIPQSGPPKKASNQRAAREKSPTPSVNSKMASFGPGAGRGQSSSGSGTTGSKVSIDKDKKVLVRPARGGNANINNQPPKSQTPGVTNTKTSQSTQLKSAAASNKAPPPRQTQPGVAKWNSGTEVVALEDSDVQISLTSYTHPRPSGKGSKVQTSRPTPGKTGAGGTGQSPRSQQQQVNKTEVLTRFGKIEKDQETSSDLKKYWMPDKACKDCSDCGVKFNIFVRRHHCRICGRIFCNTCCSMTIPGAHLRPDLQGNLRVCKDCKTIFREFHFNKPKPDSLLQSSENQGQDSSPLSPRLSVAVTTVKSQVTSGDPQPLMPGASGDGNVMRSGSGTFNRGISSRPVSVLSPHKSWDDASGRSQELMDLSPSRSNVLEFDMYRPRRRGGMPSLTGFDSLPVGQRDERLLDLDEDEVEFIVTGVWLKLLSPEGGLLRQNHRYRLRTFPNTYSAHSLVEWLVLNGHVRSREVALRVGQALVDTKRLKIVSSLDSEFRDDTNMFLELGEAADFQHDDSESPLVTDAPKWFQRLKDDEDSELEKSYGIKPHSDITKEFLHVPSAKPSSPLPNRGLVMSSVNLKEVTNRTSNTTGLTKSCTSLSHTDLDTQEEYIMIDRETTTDTPQSYHNSPYKPPIMDLPVGASVNVSVNLPALVATAQGSPVLKKMIPSPSRQHNSSFSVIDNDEIVQALPVDGLSSATEAAKEFAEESSKVTISNEKAEIQFERVYETHFNTLLIQMMKSLGVNLQWLDIIKPLIMEASRNVRTDVFPEDLMDVNQYVKIKKIPRGKRSSSSLVYGVVCTKNVTHKKMYKSIRNPKILLLKCAFEFQRKENQISSFDTLQLQEEKYLKNLVVKVNAIKPNLILVQKSVSRLALEMLYDLGIVVVVNVKPSVMNRVARSTKGQILHSLDQLFFGNTSVFGTCGHFYIRNFLLPDGDKKTLMYFDNCPPQLGCVITLQGGTSKELKKVKKVTQFGLHIAYNSLLETTFLIDEFAWPSTAIEPPPDTVDEYSSTCSTPEWPLFPSLGYPLDSLSQEELHRKLEALQFVDVGDIDTEDATHAVNMSGASCDILINSPRASTDDTAETVPNMNESISSEVTTKEDDLSSSSHADERVLPTLEEKDEEEVHSKLTNKQTKEDREPSITDASSLQDDPGLVLEIKDEPSLGITSSRSRKISSKRLDKLAEEEFKLAYSSQIVSVSPYVKFTTPYLQTPRGRSADARYYLPKVVYWSYQFKPKNLLNQAQKNDSKLESVVEMGLTKTTVLKTVSKDSVLESSTGMENEIQQLVPTHPSYKSVATHPFTSSIFLLQSNTNEMKSALADFRSRAGYQDEENIFFFSSAEKASDYHLHLNNVFSDCRQFELAAAALEESAARSERDSSLAGSNGSEVKAKKSWWERKFSRSPEPPVVEEKTQGDPFAKLMVGKVGKGGKKGAQKEQAGGTTVSIVSKATSDSEVLVSKDDSIVSDNDTLVSKDIQSVSQNIAVVSTDEDGVSTDVIQPSIESESEDLGLVEKFPLVRSGSIHKNRDSGGGIKLSEKFGTLDDVDRSRRSKVENEEENLDNLGDLNYETWLAADEQVDCFDPLNHQGISILFSNTAHDGLKHQLPCVPPCVIPMFYYGRNDISLGEFLQRYCFKQFYRCQTCGSDMVQHQRHVIHASSAIHISMQQLESALPGNDDAIYTWLACKFCDQCTPYTLMSKNSLLFSFAKFLELKFHCGSYVTRFRGDDTTTCTHCLQRDYVQYFCHKNKIAAFQPSTVDLLEVLIPPRSLSISTPRGKYHLDFKTEIKHIQRIVEGVFYRISQKLEKYRLDPVAGSIDDHIANSKAERDALRSKVKHLKDLVVSGGFLFEGRQERDIDLQKEEEIISNLQDDIADLKRCVCDVVDCWNINLEVLDMKVRDYRRKMRERDSAQGENSRDSPAAVTAPIPSSTQTTPSQVIPTAVEPSRGSPGHTPFATPPDSALSSRRESLDSGPLPPSNDSSSITMATQELSTSGKASGTPSPSQRRAKSHSRNFSDGGLLLSSGDKEHKRQLSDSTTIRPSQDTLQPSYNRELADTKSSYGSEATFSSTDILSATPSVGASLSELTDGESPIEVQRSNGEEGKVDSESHVLSSSEISRESSQKRSLQDVPIVTGKEPSSAAAGQKEEELQTDSGGILARFRGKEQQESRDDPNKFYLLDIIPSNSPGMTRANPPPVQNSQDVPLRTTGKRQSSMQRRSVLAQTATESHSEGKGDKRALKDKEKTGILARPFLRLIPPFPNGEHHSMHSIITIPLGIYEKEPTSIIAFALSSREYERKLFIIQEKSAAKLGGVLTKVVEDKPVPTASPKVRRQSSEVEKPPSGATLKTNFKAVLNELKKKGSSISLFSGSTSISTTQNSSDVFDPSADQSRRSEFSTSFAGKSHEPNSQSSRLSDPSSEGVGPSPGVGVADEIDSGKSTPHISLEFTSPDKSSSFFCKVYYAEEFRQLRELIFPSGEERFIRSLSRCVKYDAKGGKSRSAFCKVADDRFILKQVKSIEISSFELFAPHYLQHVTKALEEKRPLTFGKILGAYSIGFRNSKTGNSKRLDVLVMENLLYGHSHCKVFDLKGSMRSRYIDPTKESSGDVLLDENYLNSICCNPVYVHPHSKCVLMQAILADTEFLAQNAIMDYSLLTCIDESTGELVVGIIDYVRTFTLDKRLEMYLKKTAGKVLPTIVYPELYRKRFCDAMDRYFTVVPDKWTGLGADVKFL